MDPHMAAAITAGAVFWTVTLVLYAEPWRYWKPRPDYAKMLEAALVRDAFRETYPDIVKLWKDDMTNTELRRKVTHALDVFKGNGEFEVGGVFFRADAADTADWLATMPAFAGSGRAQLAPHVEAWARENVETSS